MYNYIAVSGTIGAGKTELAKKIAQLRSSRLILEEFANNSFLEKFYKDPGRYAFPLEISFLFGRYQQLNIEFSNADLFSSGFVSDYFFDKSLLFAKNNLAQDQLNVFVTLFKAFHEQLPSPDLLIYLHRPIEVLLKNIKKRGRPYEQEIKDEYLENLQFAYLSYFKTIRNFPVCIVELDNSDFLTNSKMLSGLMDLTARNHNFGINIFRAEDLLTK